MMSALRSPGMLIQVKDLIRTGGDDRRLRKAVATGEVVRLLAGTFVRGELWRALSLDEQYLLRIAAVDRTLHGQVIFSHQSAAAIWGYPTLGPWPRQVHIAVGSSSGRRSSPAIIRHVVDVDDDELRMVDGFLVTSPLRTVCDVARSSGFAGAVAIIDAGLHSGPPSGPFHPALGKEQILDRLAQNAGGRGIRTATAAAVFGDGASGSTGESLSRVNIHLLRMPAPALQVPVLDAHGRLHHTDFGWEESLGEFDGRFKYSRNKYTKGHPPEEVVWQEKLREDAIRAASGKPVIRWVWDHLTGLASLERILRSAGLRPDGER